MSSKRAIRRKACKGKVRHQCAEHAWAHLRALLKKRDDGLRMNVYRCRFCGGWHVGHSLHQTGFRP